MTTEIPPAIRTTVATLRTASNWLPDEQRDMLREAADATERAWDGGCCPVCEETFCDGGCPLEDLRATLAKEDDREEPCDGHHPLIRHDGSMIYLYDLVTHPGCPHQPWAGPEDTTQVPRVPAEVIEALVHVGRRMLDIELSTIPKSRPLREARAKTPAPSPNCYEASWGRVHSRPSCRCPR